MTAGPAERAVPGPRLAPRVTAGALAGLVPLLTGTVVLEAVLNHQRADGRTGLALTLMLWVIAAAGLVVAWHQPRNAIGWVQTIVDRRFNRARYDADRIVAAFSDRFKDAVDLDAVRADLLAVTYEALEPAHVSVWTGDGAS